MRDLHTLWQDRLAAYALVMSAVRASALEPSEIESGNRTFGLPTLARLLTLREIVRHGALASSALR